MKKLHAFVLFLWLTPLLISAQNKKVRLQPGKFYEAGEMLYAPRFGFTAKVPDGWQGSLPRESEVFFLQTVAPDIFGEVYVYGHEKSDLQALKNNWLSGVNLSETIRIKATSPVVSNDMIASEVVGEGQAINKGNRGYVVARCSQDGPCIVAFATMPKQFYEPIKKSVEQFLSNASFEPPHSSSPYATLNWSEFLANKTLITHTFLKGGAKETEVNLCGNGRFTANIKKTGFMKNQNPQYKGRLGGTWSTTGIGEMANVTFEFTGKRKLAPVEITLTIKEDQIYANDERYFVAKSTKCR